MSERPREMTGEAHEARSIGMVAGLAGVAVALVLSAAALITAMNATTGAPAADAPDATRAAAATDGDVPASVAVELDEMTIGPEVIEVAEGGALDVVNLGAAPHDLVVEGHDAATSMLDGGEQETLELGDLPPGTYTVYCSVPGHRQAGMEATLIVGGDDGESSDGDTGADTDPDATTQTASLSYDPNATPEDDFVARDPRLSPAPDGDVHEHTIRVSQIQGEVAPGVTQELWSFDDVVPGPVLRGTVGDTFRITLINDADMPHSIDFHSSKVDPATEMRSIDPGEQLVYEFEAKHAGAWMYHCGTDPVLHHTGNGQYGVMIVDPPDLPEVDHEYVFVQSEFYLGADGEPGDYAKMLDEDWDIVAFNGYANQYVHDPITDVDPDERVRVWLLNAGPSENSAFHVIGSIFDTVFKEGSYRLHPDRDAPGGAQALDLQPAQGGFVEFTFDVDGYYPFVTHKFANVPRGAAGAFVVGDTDEAASH